MPLEPSPQRRIADEIAADLGRKRWVFTHHFDWLAKDLPDLGRPGAHFLVPDKRLQTLLLNRGVPESNIHFCLPKRLSLVEPAHFKKQANEKGFRGYLLYAAQSDASEAQRLRLLEEVMSGFPEWVLWVRPHPQVPLSAVWKRGVKNIEMAPPGLLVSLVNETALFLTGTSSGIYEAVWLHKPAIVVNPEAEPYPHFVVDSGLAQEARSESELRRYMTEVLS